MTWGGFLYPCPFFTCRWQVKVRTLIEGRQALVRHVRDKHGDRGRPLAGSKGAA